MHSITGMHVVTMIKTDKEIVSILAASIVMPILIGFVPRIDAWITVSYRKVIQGPNIL